MQQKGELLQPFPREHALLAQVRAKVEKMFEMELKGHGSPMGQARHPELDDAPLLTDLMRLRAKHQMLVGCANWVVTLGRFNAFYAVAAMA